MSSCCFSKWKQIWSTRGICNFLVEKMSHSRNECFAKPISGFKIFPQSSQISIGENAMLLERGQNKNSLSINECRFVTEAC